MYNDETKCCPVPEGDCAEMPNVTQITNEIHCLIGDALQMAYHINQYLFGFGEPVNEKPIEPKCYRDDLVLKSKTLKILCEELAKTCRGIGV